MNRSEQVLGTEYRDGETIVLQGESGDCMYVIQSGRVEVLQSVAGNRQHLAFLEVGDFFGEMALFERENRSATVEARGTARILRVDKKTLLRRLHEDPLLAVNLLKTMSHRIRDLNGGLASQIGNKQ